MFAGVAESLHVSLPPRSPQSVPQMAHSPSGTSCACYRKGVSSKHFGERGTLSAEPLPCRPVSISRAVMAWSSRVCPPHCRLPRTGHNSDDRRPMPGICQIRMRVTLFGSRRTLVPSMRILEMSRAPRTQSGPLPRTPRTEELTLHILFVCTGNICRSPTAERLATAYCARTGITGLTASSAGTHAVVAHPIHRDAALTLGDLGADSSNFAARRLTRKIAASADLVLTMTRAHRTIVLEVAPHKLHRTFTLVEAARLVTECGARQIDALANLRSMLTGDDTLDIPDPIGQSPHVYCAVGHQIAELLPPILEICRPE